MKCRIIKIDLGGTFCPKTLINLSTNDSCHISRKLLPNTIKECDNLRQHPIILYYKCIPKSDPIKVWSYCYLDNYSSHNLTCSQDKKIQLKKVTLTTSSGGDIGEKASCVTTSEDWSASVSESSYLDPFLCDGYWHCSNSIYNPRNHPIMARDTRDDSFHTITHITIEYQCVNGQQYLGKRGQKISVCDPHEREQHKLKVDAITMKRKVDECVDGK